MNIDRVHEKLELLMKPDVQEGRVVNTFFLFSFAT